VSDLVEGLKRDESKVMPTLVHPDMMEGLARVFECGLTKYHKGSWMEFTADQAREVLPDAAMRHFNEWLRGNRVSPENLDHLLQASWNLLVLWFHENREGNP
jgi:hypothetical protein